MKKLFCFSWLFSPSVASNFRSASFCSLFRFVGVSMVTVTYWSPRPRPLSTGMPLPFRRNTVPVWVPSGMAYFTLPSMVGISSSPPSTAWAKVMGASQNTAVPSRRKMSWGRTMTVISRSPLGPPFLPAWPWPRREMVWPSSIPAGMETLMVRRCRMLPLP